MARKVCVPSTRLNGRVMVRFHRQVQETPRSDMRREGCAGLKAPKGRRDTVVQPIRNVGIPHPFAISFPFSRVELGVNICYLHLT